MCRSRPFALLFVSSEPSAVSFQHPPCEGGHTPEEEPPAPCLVAPKAIGLSLSASPAGEKGARWPDSIYDLQAVRPFLIVNDTHPYSYKVPN